MSADESPLPSVWTRPRRQRREQPALSREQIVSEALKLLDGEGIDALSMRRLGGRLGAVATAIYWHVANKDELIELVVDEVYSEMRVPDVEDPADWRAAAVGCARSMRSVILRHPWMVSVLDEVGLAYLGPNMMRQSDRMLAVFEAAGFALREADQAVQTVAAYVLGTATSEAAMLTKLAGGARSERDVVEDLWPAAEAAALAYPRLRELYATYRGEDPEKNREETFAYGLERVLDGLQARLGPAGGSAG
ncbi:TetR/AcrR family transcriptional regulator [Streptosporangium roseum]|uniref:Transcriptional regulator, TetR family n=1 Tax=Streptosporangium roseum (strain ATCC 12428 / DSM 43021 / JCM 3005 / KCTC 9067 / NCIMB 10171 / NRRL 2505 / NI 9100) TaxID=479432 RepID=D2AVQ3_STRRD|nr:TetR/AcrR family transcriptional regulator [Streptosporangium roseum]ACZ90699.1 putative transcriptional regulator, TetR family [Streptosporangium roseum DSM 43021]